MSWIGVGPWYLSVATHQGNAEDRPMYLFCSFEIGPEEMLRLCLPHGVGAFICISFGRVSSGWLICHRDADLLPLLLSAVSVRTESPLFRSLSRSWKMSDLNSSNKLVNLIWVSYIRGNPLITKLSGKREKSKLPLKESRGCPSILCRGPESVGCVEERLGNANYGI